MKDIFSSDLRRAKAVVVSMMNSACDAKKVNEENVYSLIDVFYAYIALLSMKHEMVQSDIHCYFKEKFK